MEEITVDALLMTVENGEKLMKILSSLLNARPDIIFLDINMPRKNGIQCLCEIRSDRNLDNIPVFMLSTADSISIIDTAYDKGANLYIPKNIFFSSTKQMLEKLFSFHWEKYLTKIPKEKFILKG